MSLSPSLLPLAPICDPIAGHVAGWTRPYSRQCRTEATLTGTAGPNVEFELLELSCTIRGGSCLEHSSIRPVTHTLTHSFNQSITQSGPSRQGVDARCLSHYYTVDSVDEFGMSGQANLLVVHAGHAVLYHTQSDTTTRSHATAIPHIKKGLVWSRSAVYPCPCYLLPCHAMPMPLLFPRLIKYFPAHISQ